MKILKTILLVAITLVGSKSALAWAGDNQISCGAAAGVMIQLQRYGNGYSGYLIDAYNGGTLGCRGYSARFLDGEGTLDCIGYWDHSFEGSEVVKITIAKNSDGKLQASYLRDWDGRNGQVPRLITADCQIQETASKP